MSWRVEEADPLALLRELPDCLSQTAILRVPVEHRAYRVPVLAELHRVAREDGTLWLLGAAHEAAAIKAGWQRPRSRGTHPRLPRAVASGECLSVTLLAKRPDFHFNPSLPPLGRARPDRGRAGVGLDSHSRRRARCIPLGTTREPPRQLIDWCIQASTSPRACQLCGAPWRRSSAAQSIERVWRAGCEHGDGGGRCLVLDPFCAAGLTGVLTVGAGRSFLGIEHDPLLARCAQRRLAVSNWAWPR